MPKYVTSETFFCRETGLKYEAGATTDDLTEDQADAYNASHPGLLKPARLTAQATVDAVRVPKKRGRRKSA